MVGQLGENAFVGLVQTVHAASFRLAHNKSPQY